MSVFLKLVKFEANYIAVISVKR